MTLRTASNEQAAKGRAVDARIRANRLPTDSSESQFASFRFQWTTSLKGLMQKRYADVKRILGQVENNSRLEQLMTACY
jgi:hypothetical protein